MGMSPRLLRPRGTFTPRRFSSLAGWWDASALSSMFQNSNGTTAVSENDNPVGYWADLSGNGRHLTQSTNNNRPLFKINYYNSLPAVLFDGSNDSLWATSLPALATSPLTVVLCIDSLLSSASQDRGVITLSASSVSSSYNNDGGLQMVANSTGRGGTRRAFEWYNRSASGGLELETVGTATSQPVGKKVYSVVANGTTGTFFQDGTQVDSQSATVSTSTSRLFLGSLVDSNNPSLYWNGRILEVCIYSRALSTSDRLTLERHLGSKWGVTVA